MGPLRAAIHCRATSLERIPLRGAYAVDVHGIKVPMPRNSKWDQNKELVRVLRQVREEHGNGRGMLKQVYNKMDHRNVVIARHRATKFKVKMVDDALALNPQMFAEEIIDTRIHDRLSLDGAPVRGNHDIMTEDEFKDAVRRRALNEHACTIADFHEILLERKKKHMYCWGRTPAHQVCIRKQ